MRKKRSRKFNMWNETKQCSRCKQDLLFKFFHRNQSKYLGIESACRECVSERKAKLYLIKKLRKRIEQ